ncbi:FAD-dependent oxidoreductase [Mycobacterium palustre]|uniref:Amine oxidase n=2 Tax=Mycobacterium palustre TaxID=153971 RepID=A0A1X1Z407_9MYCO|nr:FAD-dependent oxidoreductase [Mycobacterium palustre]ORW17961.1 amine oxidase [Mycobacterium palustre]
MAGLSAAWRLSEPGWRNQFESITVYQRGWRLGGKAASSRGDNGRIQEHGLHIWLGSYENAFRLLRECYAELDRPTTDPAAPIQTWRQALIPADNPGLADRFGDDWLTWLGTHPVDDRLPGEPGGSGRTMTVTSFIERALRLLLAFADSLREPASSDLHLTTSPVPPKASPLRTVEAVQRAMLAALVALADAGGPGEPAAGPLDETLIAIRDVIDYDTRPGHRRTWLLLSLVTAAVRGIVADNLITRPNGFRAINDEEFGHWLLRHGGHPDVLESAMVRGLYDFVFGYAGGDPERPSIAAGLMVFLVGHVLFGYQGALFWKMTAGMGDVVIAPLYQVLRNRGVRFEFFHRLDALHLDADRRAIEAVSLGRQVRLADGVEQYDPLTVVKGLPVFPDSPLIGQLDSPPGDGLESHFGSRDDAEARILRRGKDFDQLVLAVSLGMVPVVAGELVADRPEWRDMTARVRTVATQAFQVWMRPSEAELGWDHPGSTISAYQRPFETWASMPQTLWAEAWPDAARPRTVAYFCGSLDAPWPPTEPPAEYLARYRRQVYADAAEHLNRHVGLFLPGAVTDDGFDWSLLAGNDGLRGPAALTTQHVSVNVDPSDRYVQSVPGSDRYRLRPDESGYDNLVLAGDWTDCGMNAGCIEAAVMSGLQAANALLGRGRFYRIRGYWLP